MNESKGKQARASKTGTALANSLLVLLLLQTTEPDLKWEKKRTLTGTPYAMFVVIATHEDGRPVRGTIACTGGWFKYADEEKKTISWALPFRTDSRGAAVFNPRYDDDYFMSCWATADTGEYGKVSFTLEPGVRRLIMVRVQ